ncbi:MAG: metalloregulator ArsR/SmtB family transcription factor [Candidatus Thiodiazotropha sp. 6PLUC2]
MNINPKELFSSLSHETRIRCISLLLQHEELCVCELTHAIGAAQPHISRHLAQLREAGVILDRRDGLWIHYRINPDLPSWVMGVLSETLHGIKQEPPFKQDADTLAVMPNRPGSPRCA